MRGRNRPRPGYQQFLKRQFNKSAEERRWNQAKQDDAKVEGKSLLDQDPAKIKVTPIVRYRHVCQCGQEFISGSREATCRRCGSNMLIVTMVRETIYGFQPI